MNSINLQPAVHISRQSNSVHKSHSFSRVLPLPQAVSIVDMPLNIAVNLCVNSKGSYNDYSFNNSKWRLF
ncbi:hypothetical protein SAMN04487995_3831 [Dyadobacter koreensis]|uniref:Uncharacterized protein n=1 Tax=Dyadobacter koreensis TaxID=408657 RepID=A0A1H6XN24_9BACT|nr:hypothetical protein SAMN04487995_3831 [Dyadobacter koreensis]